MRSKILLLIAALASCVAVLRSEAAETFVITEFMAANNSTLADEDGAYSDWIEIYNTTSTPANIGGWYLTDSANNLRKWQFPPTNIAPHSFIVVFASSKDRRVPGRPLHANFALGAGGEFLALVKPDGTNVATSFSPEFPDQFGDISYGFLMPGTTTTILPSGAPARALVPTSDIGTAWRTAGFDDSAWQSGTTGVGYDLGTNYHPAIGLDIGAAMSNVNASAFVRVPFNVTDPASFKALTLRMRYDDGFVAYLNGTEVARRNAPATNEWNSSATRLNGPPAPGVLTENFEGSATQFTLSQHAVPPAPAVQNAGAGSTGRFLRLTHDGVNAAFNSVAFAQTAPGLFEEIEADIDFRLSNAANNPADGFAIMFIPTRLYGTNGPGINVNNVAVEEPNFAGVFAVGVDFYPHTTANDVSIHWNSAEKLNVNIPRATFELVAGQFHRMKISLRHVAGGARVTVTLTGNVNGTPTAPYTPINDVFVAGLNAYETRLQIAARTGGLNHQLDLDNIQVQFRPPPGIVAFEEIDITPGLGALTSGQNVLAIQGLNIASNDLDFIISPELVAADFILGMDANYIAPATPGSWNNVAGAGSLGKVSFEPASGTYVSDTVQITMFSESSSAQIRYTLNGAEPTATSPLYTGPITINSNTVVRARAFETGKVDGEISAANYVLIDASLTNFNSNLPLVIIDTLGQPIVADSDTPAYVVTIDTNNPAGRSSFTSRIDHRGRALVELRGQSSLGFPKNSIDLELNSERDRDKADSLLGLPPGSDWALYAPYTDKTLMNDVLAYELHEAMGHYSVRRRYVEVFVRNTAGKLSTNDYRGIYVLLEKIRIDENRVDIAELDENDNTEPNITGGYIWKKDKDSPGDVNFTTVGGQVLKYHDPDGNDLTAQQRAWLLNHINEFETVLYGANWRDPLYGYMNYIEPGSFVDQHWIVEFPKNIDGYRLSNYMSKDRGGKIRMEPIWDWNLSWGNANYLEGGYTNGWYFSLLGGVDDIWLSRLRTDPDFYQRIIDRWGELRTNLFALSNLLARVDTITNLLGEAVSREFARWPRLGTYVWPNPDGALNSGGTPLPTRNWDVNYVGPTSYAALIQQQKRWITGRHTWIENQFLKAPALSRASGMIVPGDTLTITGSLGSVYYTLDGTDPRGAGGVVSPSAILYNGTITLTNNAGVIARSFHTNSWSPPARGTYVVQMPALAITEIMYHPTDPPTNSAFEPDDFEYVEIRNTGSNAINLAGARLAGGIDYTFAPSVLVPLGQSASNTFDAAGTSYAAASLSGTYAPAVTAGGPDGSFLRLIQGGSTNLVRNRIAFAQTTTGNYARVTADFDFRASTVGQPATSGTPTTQNFEGAPDSTNYILSGSAVVTNVDAGSSGNFMRLVPAVNSLFGNIGFNRTAPGAWNTVVASFDFRITPGTGQADGMGVAFLNTTTYGASGAPPTFQEEPNLTGSIGIGLDVYSNAEVNNNHVSLHYGTAVGSPVIPPFDLSNGRFHRAQVIIRFSGGRALVTLRVTPDINLQPGTPVTLLQDAIIPNVNPYEMRVAFSARTGGENASHDVDNVDVQYLTSAETTAGLSLALLPTSTFGTSGNGSTLAHYTDAPTITNGLAVDLTFHPSNYLNDAAIYWNRSIATTRFLPLNIDNGEFHHMRVVLDAYAGGTYATVVLTPNSLGTPGSPIVLASNLFIAGLAPKDWRLELAGRNGQIDTTLDVDNVVMNHFGFESLVLGAGESILVVNNRAAFESRYGTGHRIAGEFSGKLDNAGERLVLLGPVGEPIMDFRYSDDWYRVTDGLGFSLVNRTPGASGVDYSSPEAWRNSTSQSGSPGAPEPVLSIAPVVVNEVLANSVLPDVDRIELHNPTTNIVDIGGWFLTDDLFEPKKFRIPNGTMLQPGGFVVFTEAQFNAVPNTTTNFGLGADGDEVWLFSATATGDLTGYIHGFDFGGSDEQVSLGRYVDSAGGEDFPAQVAMTFGATNAGPAVGPIVITEVMYRPLDTGSLDNSMDEYIELMNISGSPVALFSSAVPTNTWHLRDAVEFDFPENITLAAGERVLVLNFNPTNATQLAAFRAAYNVSPTVRVFGPYEGKLDNSGDDIHLNRPLPPGTNGTVYVRADKVNYSDSAPWPAAADGFGASLQRLNVNAYGNDPGNWAAAVPSAGEAYPGGTAPALSSQPDNVTVVGGGSATFAVTATGSSLRFQWHANGTNVPGGTNATLVLSNVSFAQAGEYRVAVFNGAGGVVSTTATLTVLGPVQFTLQPTNQLVLPGTNVTLVAAAVGSGPVTYQWSFNGTNIAGATNASYSFTGASLTNHGNYQVTAMDAYSSAISSNAFIFVRIRPGVVTNPLPVTVLQGGQIYLGVMATGAPPLYYRWLRSGALYVSNSSPELVITNAHPTNAGSWRVQVINEAGNANSANVTVTVLADNDGDGIADAWEAAYFGSASTNNPSNAFQDPDGDGMVTRDEYVAGTVPTNALSVLKLFQSGSTAAPRLEFVAQTNISYSVQCTTNLTGGNWTSISNIAAQSSQVRTVAVATPLPAGSDSRFYRVVTPAAP